MKRKFLTKRIARNVQMDNTDLSEYCYREILNNVRV